MKSDLNVEGFHAWSRHLDSEAEVLDEDDLLVILAGSALLSLLPSLLRLLFLLCRSIQKLKLLVLPNTNQ